MDGVSRQGGHRHAAKTSGGENLCGLNRQIVEIDTLALVPGDVLIFAHGTNVDAGATAQESVGVQIDESALTGESFPVQKDAGEVVAAGAFAVWGEGEALATPTGHATRLGQIAATAKKIGVPRTALQLATKSPADKLWYVALASVVLMPLLGVLRRQDWSWPAGRSLMGSSICGR